MEHDDLQREQATPARRAPAAPKEDGGLAGHVLAVQQSAGNRAATAAVQRLSIGGSEWFEPAGPSVSSTAPAGGSGPASAPTSAPPAAPATPSEAPSPEAAESSGGINDLGPVARVGTLIADSVVATSYTPGAGNVW